MEPGNPPVNVHGQGRSNATHASTTEGTVSCEFSVLA